MVRWTRRCLLCVSLLLTALTATASDWLVPLSGRQQFTVAISGRGAEITGVLVTKTDTTGTTRGAIVNEFGIHALDFTLTADRRRIRLQNLLSQLDHWYIRRVLRRDLETLFGVENGERSSEKGRRRVTLKEDGTVVLENTRYKLRYSLKKIDDTEE